MEGSSPVRKCQPSFASPGARALILLDVVGFFRGGQLPALFGIEADRHYLVIRAHVQGDLLHGVAEAVQDQIAQAGAIVIHQRQHHGLLAEILAQANGLSGLVFELQFERDLSVQVLIDADALHHHGHG